MSFILTLISVFQMSVIIMGFHPVSYTHLDVYKRQRIPGTPVASVVYARILFVCVKSVRS